MISIIVFASCLGVIALLLLGSYLIKKTGKDFRTHQYEVVQLVTILEEQLEDTWQEM